MAVLPPYVTWTWDRMSRRRGLLHIKLGARVIFGAYTDGRPWGEDDVVWVLRTRPGVTGT